MIDGFSNELMKSRDSIAKLKVELEGYYASILGVADKDIPQATRDKVQQCLAGLDGSLTAYAGTAKSVKQAIESCRKFSLKLTSLRIHQCQRERPPRLRPRLRMQLSRGLAVLISFQVAMSTASVVLNGQEILQCAGSDAFHC